jgi:3-oxoadipate CoA-transferase, beta subunit
VTGWPMAAVAEQVAADLPSGSYVNLGIGLPTLVAGACRRPDDIAFHCENGVLGAGPRPGEDVDPDLIDAGKNPITMLAGGAFFGHPDSFAMIRTGRIAIAVMGAYEVSEHGDLANWSTGLPEEVPAVGGAMDLAAGAGEVWVVCRHVTSDGAPKIVERCSYPLTGPACVTRVYTDLAVLVVGDGVSVDRLAPGVTAEELRARTGCALRLPIEGDHRAAG